VKRLGIYLLITVFATALGIWHARGRPTEYWARTSIIVGQPPGSWNISKEDIDASRAVTRTYADLIHERPLLENIARRADLTTWERIGDQLDVHVTGGNRQVLDVVVRATSPREAMVISAAVPMALAEQAGSAADQDDTGSVRAFGWSHLAEIQSHIQATEADLDFIRSRIRTATNAAAKASLRFELERVEERAFDWRQDYASLFRLLSRYGSGTTVSVLERPTVTAAARWPITTGIVGGSAAIGILVATLIVFIGESRAKRIPGSS
jgi:hypothetical protein